MMVRRQLGVSGRQKLGAPIAVGRIQLIRSIWLLCSSRHGSCIARAIYYQRLITSPLYGTPPDMLPPSRLQQDRRPEKPRASVGDASPWKKPRSPLVLLEASLIVVQHAIDKVPYLSNSFFASNKSSELRAASPLAVT